MIKKIIFITSLILLLNGCAAVMIYKHFKEDCTTNEDKQKFLTNFNDINSKRQKEGLQPLDICAEKRKFDADWANEDPQCK
jgi:PBP1b-binding outer membrane lipoprotein LpoB